MKNEQLSQYADISTGRSFRGAVKKADKEGYRVIQIGDVLFEKGKAIVDFEQLTQTDLNTTRKVDCLSDGDLIMIAKGKEKNLVLLNNVPEKVICTQHFLVIKPNLKFANITSNFLKAYLESDFAREWLHANSGGNYQSTLSKATIEKLPIPYLSDENGTNFIEYILSVNEELEKYHQLIEARKNQVAGLISEIVKQ